LPHFLCSCIYLAFHSLIYALCSFVIRLVLILYFCLLASYGAVGFGDPADNYYQLAVVSCHRDLCFYGMLLRCSAYPSYLLWFIIFA